jgi:hypothetical protein
VPSYLVETYSPLSRAAEVEAAIARLAGSRSAVRHVRATFVPEDEICFHLFEGPSLEAIRETLMRAAICYERIVEAVE